MNTILKYFLQGLILFIPFGLTLLLFLKIFQFFESMFSFVGFTGSVALDTLLSLLALFVFITIVGLLATSFIFKRFFTYLETKFEKAPFVRHVYSPIKDFMNAFTGNKKKFTSPVLILTNPQANIQEIGFITQSDLTEWGIHDKIAVYIPMSYSFSGKLIIVPQSQISLLNCDGSDAMKFIVSGGVTDVD